MSQAAAEDRVCCLCSIFFCFVLLHAPPTAGMKAESKHEKEKEEKR
jgi:hypothetical protein